MHNPRHRDFWRPAAFGIALLAAATALAQDTAIVERMKKDIFFLASEQCEGRGVDTKGIHIAADYIVNELKQAGLKPGGKNGTFFQPFTLNEGDGEVAGVNSLTLQGPLGQTIELQMDKDFKVLPLSASGKAAAPIIFAGYGVTAPTADYDDFKGHDVKGKIVVVLRRVPRWDNDAKPFAGNRDLHAGFENKIGNCELNQAAAVIVVNDQSEVDPKDSDKSDKFIAIKGAFPVGVPVVQLRRGLLDAMLISGNGTSLSNLEKDIDRDLKPRSGPIAGWSASLTTNLKRANYACKNIIGVVEGAGPLANETVVIGAHYDHLGFGGRGSLAQDKNKKQIHPGADDNGSGTTTVIELARRFAAMKDRQTGKGVRTLLPERPEGGFAQKGPDPFSRRRLVFMLFSGEERGLFGSKHYCNKEPLFPLENTVAMVNLDMVGRLGEKEPKLKVEGVGTGKGLKDLVEKLNGDFGFKLEPVNGGQGPSDHDSFCRKRIPVLFLWTGTHSDYHRPTDLAERINVPGMAKIAGLTEKIIADLATEPQRREYVHIAETSKVSPGGGGAKLRIIPDYGDETNKGVLIESVVETGAGAKGGIKAGDRIVSIAGQPTPNVNTYMTVMQRQKAGVAVEVVVERMGAEVKLKVVPE